MAPIHLIRLIRQCSFRTGLNAYQGHCKVAWNLVKHRKLSTSLCTRSEQQNVILMGSPGSGKTTVGRILSTQLGMPVLDVDNDHLENHWKMPVSQKLAEVGGARFIEEEGKATMDFKARGHIVSLTGSNPMYQPAMDYLKKTGVVVFLDVQNDDVVERLESMKVNRIVGQGEGVPMMDILRYRQQFYEGNYDIRVLCKEGERPENIAHKVKESISNYQNETKYESTRGHHQVQNLLEAILQGQPEDGGLFVPSNTSIPQLSLPEWKRLIHLSYPERALRVLEQYIHPRSIAPNALAGMINSAYSAEKFSSQDIFPVVRLEHNQYVQELFHGPTASFKDSALQLMPKLFHHAMTNVDSNEKYLILVATSGDTGGAVLDGFSRIQNDAGVAVTVLFPEKGISTIQKAQMTSAPGKTVQVIGINADFDYCQSFIKKVFGDKEVKSEIRNKTGFRLSAANSINWGRLLPQVVHHVSAYLDLVREGVVSLGDEVDLCIPTGNFGNILAAHYSKMMGIPWRRLICASNMNSILTDFINTGSYDLSSRRLHLTSSPAIDILKSSNLERYLYDLTGNNDGLIQKWYQELESKGVFSIGPDYHKLMQKDLVAGWCDEKECSQTIMDTWTKTGYLLDPHTAVAKAVADRFQDRDVPMLISSTAHPAKFADDVLRSIANKRAAPLTKEEGFSLLGQMVSRPKMHECLKSSVLDRPRLHNTVLEADKHEIINSIETFLQKL